VKRRETLGRLSWDDEVLMNWNPLDLIVSFYLISSSGILGVAHKCLQGAYSKLDVKRLSASLSSLVPVSWMLGREMNVTDIPFGDSGCFCSLVEMMMRSLEHLLKSS